MQGNQHVEVFKLDETKDPRLQAIAQQFMETFSVPCNVLARAPGRCNAIGEHTDYSGGSVLPSAIGQDCVVALRADPSLQGIHLHSTRPHQYNVIQLSTDPQQPVHVQAHTWGNYFLAAYKGVHEHFATVGKDVSREGGLQVLVDGNIPEGAGLSSSSALVVASMLALLGAYNALGTHSSPSKKEIAELASRSERHVGTQGGGMDQAVSLMAQEGCALHVCFSQPQMQVEPVPLPPNVCFAVCHSLVEAHKAQGANTSFNMRVAECRLAAKMLVWQLKGTSADLQQSTDLTGSVRVLGDVGPHLKAQFGHSFQELEKGLRSLLHEHTYSPDEVSSLCGGLSAEELLDRRTGLVDAVQAVASSQGSPWNAQPCLHLLPRTLHFFSECQRVSDFIAACKQGHTDLEVLGVLLTASHRSCADLYDCSCPELEELVAAATAAGAKGARLTGAGWGGCVVCLVHAADTAHFKDRLLRGHYRSKGGKPVQPDECVFCVKPAGGAAVYELTRP